MEQIWFDIPDYKGLYQIDKKANIKSLKRKVPNEVHLRILKQRIGTTGYKMVVLYRNGKRKNYKIHQLMAMTFLGHKPDKHNKVIDHKDRNKLNNKLSNLRIVSARENASFKRGKSKFTGVDKQKNKWRARIYINKKRKHLGFFNNELDAHKAYQKALEEWDQKSNNNKLL